MGSKIELGVYRTNVRSRHIKGRWSRLFYLMSLVVAFFALAALAYNIITQAVGLVAVDFAIAPETLSERPLDELTSEELGAILGEHAGNRSLMLVFEQLSHLDEARDMAGIGLSESLREGTIIPEEWQSLAINEIDAMQRGELLGLNLSHDQMMTLLQVEVIQEEVLESWSLTDSLLNRDTINTTQAEKYPTAQIEWRWWANSDFMFSSLSSTPALTGIRPALLGTIWLMTMTALIAFPLGVGAAIYLEEYASDSLIQRMIALNIRNLAGVPSIIYGMLGLAIFVRTLSNITGGAVFGVDTANGRTILSGAMTLSLLILPIIIINTQESLKAVPQSIRQASYGLGATRWQTISRAVFPMALPGIMTGTILAMSRAIGETAPILVVGAATFISVDPNGPFSNFTALPILIYNWTSQPDPQFQNAAAAGIVILLAMLLTMNSVAIVLRNRFSRDRV